MDERRRREILALKGRLSILTQLLSYLKLNPTDLRTESEKTATTNRILLGVPTRRRIRTRQGRL